MSTNAAHEQFACWRVFGARPGPICGILSVMFCTDYITISDVFVGAGVIATLVGVGVALFLGVGGWRRDARIRETRRKENRRTFAILLAHDIRRLQNQSRDVRKFFEEKRLGPSEAGDRTPINLFGNPFGTEYAALMVLSPISVMEQSAEWAKHLPHNVVKIASALSSCEKGWNEKALLLQGFPQDKILPANLSDDLMFILNRIEEKASELLPHLNDIAAPNS